MLDFLKQNTVNVTNKRKVSNVADIRVMSNNILFSNEALSKINHVPSNNVYIGDMGEGGMVIASVANNTGMGQKLSDKNSFVNSNLHSLLGGAKSEWEVVTDAPVYHDENGSVWAIKQSTAGVDVSSVDEATDNCVSNVYANTPSPIFN